MYFHKFFKILAISLILPSVAFLDHKILIIFLHRTRSFHTKEGFLPMDHTREYLSAIFLENMCTILSLEVNKLYRMKCLTIHD